MIIGSEKPEVKHPQVTSPNTHICTYILWYPFLYPNP
jgi:hypothetical protein